jgi:hypothetical protein
VSDYHARIMNIPCEKRGLYAQGHRDARHAAAEIALEAEAEAERLTAELTEEKAESLRQAEIARDALAEVERLRVLVRDILKNYDDDDEMSGYYRPLDDAMELARAALPTEGGERE